MAGANLSMGFTEERFPRCHVCMIYDSEDQRRGVVADYLAAGVRGGERVRYFFSRGTAPDTVRGWLSARHQDVHGAEGRGALAFASAEAGYCAGGRHDPAAVIAAVLASYGVAEQGGFTAGRTCAEMSWVTCGLPGCERFLEYEVMLNRIDVPFPHAGMCQYDARVFDGATLFKVLQVHPFMVAQGQVVQNPYYVKPEGPPIRR